LTTSSSAWQSISSVPPPPSSPGSSWDGSFQDLGAAFDEALAGEAQTRSRDTSPEEEKIGDGKKIKSIVRMKTLVGKLGFLRSLKHKEVVRDKGKEGAVDGGPMSQELNDALLDPPEQEESERHLQTMSRASDPVPQIPLGETRLQGDRQHATAPATSAPLAVKPNPGASTILDRIFAVLTCHKGSEITS
jgi:hypothetical protein